LDQFFQEAKAQYPHLEEFTQNPGHGAMAALPLIIGDRVVGGLALSFITPRKFNKEEQEFFLAVARQCAQTLKRIRADEALRATRAELETIVNQVPFPFVRCSRDLRFQFVSRPFAEMLGRTPEEIAGRPMAEIIGAEGLEAISPYIEEVLQGNQVEYEDKLPLLGVGTPFLHMVHTPDCDGQGNVIGWFAGITDITERKRAEDALHTSEKLYRTIARSIPGGGVCVVDRQFRCIVAEGSVKEAFGLSREILEGRSISEIFPPDQSDRLTERLSRNFAGEVVSYETRHNGHVYWTQQAPLTDALDHAIIVTVDITDRKRVEDALQESEERFRAILNQATAGIVRKELNGTLTFVNQAFCNMLGYSSAELVGKSIWQFTHRDDLEENKRLYDRLMLDGMPFQLEKRLIRRDGSTLWVNVSVSPVMDAEGRPRSAVAVEVDITGRKRAEEELHQLNLQLENRVETRTAQLKLAIQALKENRKRLVEVQEEERRALARELHDRVGQSLTALNVNLTVVRDRLESQVPEKVESRLADSINILAEVISAVRDVMSNLRPAVLDDYGLGVALQTNLQEFTSRFGIKVDLAIPGSAIPRLSTSTEMTLLRIAQEALLNIAKHADARTAAISIEREGSEICMTIQDDGVGMDSLQAANRPGSHGIGIMRERAEAVGGSFSLSSAVGSGTRIVVSIPIQPASASESEVIEKASND
jgi:PAS domain S-box-containing protein